MPSVGEKVVLLTQKGFNSDDFSIASYNKKSLLGYHLNRALASLHGGSLENYAYSPCNWNFDHNFIELLRN